MEYITKEIARLIRLLTLVFAIGFTIYGLALAFTASFWFGVLVLILEPTPLAIGLMKMIGVDLVRLIFG